MVGFERDPFKLLLLISPFQHNIVLRDQQQLSAMELPVEHCFALMVDNLDPSTAPCHIHQAMCIDVPIRSKHGILQIDQMIDINKYDLSFFFFFGLND